MFAVSELAADTAKPGRGELNNGAGGILLVSDIQQTHVQDDKKEKKRNICLISN